MSAGRLATTRDAAGRLAWVNAHYAGRSVVEVEFE